MNALNLALKPTPLQQLKYLGEILGIDLWIKRDDLTGDILTGGNKVRKLEYILHDAKLRGADTILVAGGLQSNLAKTTAALAIKQGIRPILILLGKEPAERSGNLFFNTVLGVEIRFSEASHPDELEWIMAGIAQQLELEGKKPYIVPFGASNGLGALGYVEACGELKKQTDEIGINFDWEFVAAGSAGTYAGIYVGKQIYGDLSKLIGISPWLTQKEVKEKILVCIDQVMPLLNGRQIKKPNVVELLIEDKFIGEGYGIPTPEALFAIKQLAKHEGIVLDYTYTGKAMAGLLNYIEQGTIKPGEKVLFWHTGGAPVLTNIEDRWRDFL